MLSSRDGLPRSGDDTLADLFPVPAESVRLFEASRPEVVARADAALLRRPDLGVLLGDASATSVRELHRYLGAFLCSVFELGLPEILRAGLPRLLSGYRSRGLTEDYLQALPDIWCNALEDQLGPRAAPLSRVCAWLREHPEAWLPELDGDGSREGGPEGGLGEEAGRLVQALLSGDAPGARTVIRSAREGFETVEAVFVEVVQPALYEIGRRWEEGRITAAQEHLASAMVARVMASLEEDLPAGGERVAVVTTAPTETHEFGAWMVADVLRAAGWSVRFLGSQLPKSDILQYLGEVRPAILAVSVTLEIHLPSLRDLVRGLRADPELAGIPVLVGGQAFRGGDRVWKSAGADAMARDAMEVASAAEALAARPGPGTALN